MKKIILAGIGLSLALSLAPAQAEPVYCTLGPALDVDQQCTFKATGTQIRYAQATPNRWSVVVTYVDELGIVRTRSSVASTSTASLPSSGTLVTVPGDTVTVRQERDCVPGTPVCGNGGTVSAFEEHA